MLMPPEYCLCLRRFLNMRKNSRLYKVHPCSIPMDTTVKAYFSWRQHDNSHELRKVGSCEVSGHCFQYKANSSVVGKNGNLKLVIAYLLWELWGPHAMKLYSYKKKGREKEIWAFFNIQNGRREYILYNSDGREKLFHIK